MSFHPPRNDAPADVDGHLALLPANATCRGIFFLDLMEQANKKGASDELERLSGVPARRYMPFLAYPYGDFLRLAVAASTILHATLPTAEALRRMGQNAYSRFLRTQPGRIVFGAVGRDPALVFLQAPNAYKLALNFGSVTASKAGPSCVRLHFRGMPALLETYQIGVMEGTIETLGRVGSVRVQVTSLADADYEVRWFG